MPNLVLEQNYISLCAVPFLGYTSGMAFQRDINKFSTLETILRLQGLFRHRLQLLRVSPLQASMLLYLDRHPHCTMNEIASALCIENLSAVEPVQLLQRKGWIRKPQVKASRKIVRLQLTKKGTAMAQKIKENIEVTNKLFALADSRKAA
jgi:DNA-binding MarR family transcriptional regulator